MKLPENYQNWIEFAKECDKILQKNPYVDTVKVGYGENISEYLVNAVKAKAFDEVMELAFSAKKEVRSLQNSIGTDMAIMTRFLILLTDG